MRVDAEHLPQVGSDSASRRHVRRVIVLAVASSLICQSALAAPPADDPAGRPSADAPAPVVECPAEDPACPQTAGQWYARGIELASAEDFLGAADAFLRSYALKPTPEALFNAALAYESAGEPVEAILIYRRHLKEPTADPESRAAAEAAIEQLLGEVAVIKGLRFDPERPPAQLWIAGELHTLEDFPLPLQPGDIEVEVVDEAGLRGRERYTLAAGDSLVLDLRALLPPVPDVEEPDREPETETETPTSERPDPALVRRARAAKPLRTSAWVALGTTGGAGIVLGVLGGLTLATSGGPWANATCFEYPEGTCPDDFPITAPEVAQRFERLRLGTNVMIGVTGAVGVGALVLGLLAIRATRAERALAKLHVRPSAGGFAISF